MLFRSRDGTGLVAICERGILAPLYTTHLELLNPVLFPKQLRKEYKVIQKQQPYKDAIGNWRLPAEGITNRLYRLFEQELKTALSVLVEDPLDVQEVATMDQSVPPSITEGVKRGRDEAETGGEGVSAPENDSAGQPQLKMHKR